MLDLHFAQTVHGLDKLCAICGSCNYSIRVCVTFASWLVGHAWLYCAVIDTCIGTFKEEPTEIKQAVSFVVDNICYFDYNNIKLSWLCESVCGHKLKLNFVFRLWTSLAVSLKLCCTWISNHDGATVCTSLNEFPSFRKLYFPNFPIWERAVWCDRQKPIS